MEQMYIFKSRGGRIIPLDENQAALQGMRITNGLEYLGMMELDSLTMFDVPLYKEGTEQEKTPEELQVEYEALEEKIRGMKLPKPIPQPKERKIQLRRL